MIWIEPVDPAEYIMQAGDELQKCINMYFGEISLQEAENPEILDEKFTPDLLKTINADYYRRLELIWNQVPTSYKRSFQAAFKQPPLEMGGDFNVLLDEYDAAQERKIFEKLFKTNHKDVSLYREHLKSFAEANLWEMHRVFVNAVTDINK